MKKLLFAGAILFGTFTFANTGNTEEFSKNETSKENLQEVKITNNNTQALLKPRGYVTIEFDINCGGQTGHMTVTYLSDNNGSLGALIELANAINQGTIQGCQQMADHGLI
ncbi:hypothetical protein [Chryseobacterium sp. RLHN22]|uniref:hypothetical protein n=1 Tax=Chryseobacterium sp. RLHN22 TaxID=3437885 RepID=UPI003D9BEEF8